MRARAHASSGRGRWRPEHAERPFGIVRHAVEQRAAGEGTTLTASGRSSSPSSPSSTMDRRTSSDAADVYAPAIGHLSDRLRAGSPLAMPWPTDDSGLDPVER